MCSKSASIFYNGISVSSRFWTSQESKHSVLRAHIETIHRKHLARHWAEPSLELNPRWLAAKPHQRVVLVKFSIKKLSLKSWNPIFKNILEYKAKRYSASAKTSRKSDQSGAAALYQIHRRAHRQGYLNP